MTTPLAVRRATPFVGRSWVLVGLTLCTSFWLGCLVSPDETARPTHSSGFKAKPGQSSEVPPDSLDAGANSTLGAPPVMPESGVKPAPACTPKNCSQLQNPCGQVPDGCGGKLSCSSCMEGQSCGGGGFNVCGLGTCKPTSCAKAGATCGDISDGCGNVIECGTCASNLDCNQNQCTCTPTTCAKAGASCGSLPDGCGNMLECGKCATNQSCVDNACGPCQPTTCALAGASCGSLPDGCGNMLSCGNCQAGFNCDSNKCICTPTTTCAQANVQCGTIDNGCGGLDCGGCSNGNQCNNNQCCSYNEICGNNVDDNCNGAVDEGCTITCGGDCNNDGGLGDHCDPSDNTGGCSDAKFQVWCKRHVSDADGDAWDAWIENWVAGNCGGQAVSDGGFYPIFSCTDSQSVTWSCQTPLVLAFNGVASVRYASIAPRFPINPFSGALVAAWPTAATPWLAIDNNGDGRISDGSELFGSSSRLSQGHLARNGFEALAELDSDHDGVVDQSDAGWTRLLVWRDFDADGVSTPEEISHATDEGLLAISVTYSVIEQCDVAGRCMRERAEFLWTDSCGHPRTGTVVDLYLPTRPGR